MTNTQLAFSIANKENDLNLSDALECTYLLSSVLEQSSVAMAICDVEGNIEYVNVQFAEFCELSAGSIINKSLKEILPNHLWTALNSNLHSGKKWLQEFESYTQEGVFFWEKLTLLPLYNQQNIIKKCLLTREDITEEKEKSDKVLVLEKIVNNALNEIYIFDAQSFYFLEVNQEGCNNLGYSMEEFESLTPFDIFPLISQDEFNKLIQPLLENSEQKIIFTTLHHRKDGSIYPVEVHLQLIETDSLAVFIAIVQDISEREAAAANLKKAKEKAEKASQAKSQFLANMSHELRTPLNAILGFSNLMEKQTNLTPQQQKNLHIINSSGEHLLNLINEVLDISKIEAGQTTLNPIEFSFFQLADEIQQLFREKMTNKGLEFKLDLPSVFPDFILTDKTKLRQILVNLIGNAIKFTPQGGNICLRCRHQELKNKQLQLFFEVEDTGEGIEEKAQAHIFDTFTQSESGKKSQEGTGLGLAISKRFVKLMGGDMSLTSIVDQGTVFKFDILVKKAKNLQELDTKEQKQVIGIKGKHNYRALIADDIEINRSFLMTVLQPLEFDLKEAENGQQVIDLCKDWLPEIIFMDLRMSVMDGFQATKILRRLYPKIIIIAVTASVFEDRQRKIQQSGFDDWLLKPFTPKALLTLIQKHLNIEYIYNTETLNHEKITLLSNNEKLNLNTDFKEKLIEALQIIDIHQINLLIDSIKHQQPELAKIIQQHLDNFEYESLLQRLMDS